MNEIGQATTELRMVIPGRNIQTPDLPVSREDMTRLAVCCWHDLHFSPISIRTICHRCGAGKAERYQVILHLFCGRALQKIENSHWEALCIIRARKRQRRGGKIGSHGTRVLIQYNLYSFHMQNDNGWLVVTTALICLHSASSETASIQITI